MAQDKISIRVSREDIEKINTLASSLSLTKTALIKKILNDGFGQTVEITNPTLLNSFEKIKTVLDGIEDELNSIGKNINQISKKINSGERFTEQDRKTLVAGLKIIQQTTDRFEKLSDLISNKNVKTVIKKRGSK
ncbi:TPA: plasmid mobilization relaxosome protein MobC [Pseudomonas aeruginosa]|uniref:plasmid mobilization relaxosome protein MobC n=1 Tax=Pseudomonas putida TaxID=303 RepID=UPI0018C78FEC|nr:plasmid mobilization relaxosome protein MobC [Pseudomonas putida]EKX3884837.1 plasmid mobilization relaxosome protein MobC [Pseudomonas aeruginosa]MBG5848127.1 plasmid mobilization relaxosome protein MobC [Pseudomonas aeruginosa]WLP05892.1 plasmid mobilization relaxosome protein MobC [Pseudomonas putida]WLP07552.1 plasmid mobilization relaxosome protein MobC [Pseudomonas putida]